MTGERGNRRKIRNHALTRGIARGHSRNVCSQLKQPRDSSGRASSIAQVPSLNAIICRGVVADHKAVAVPIPQTPSVWPTFP